MRIHGFDAILRRAVVLLVLPVLLATPRALPAQQMQAPQLGQNVPRTPGAQQPTPGQGDEDDPIAHRMQTQLALTRNKQRQQQLVADTLKLLDLATQLKAEVDKSDKDTLSLAVIKKAEEIEKLAKQVKEKMRDAQ